MKLALRITKAEAIERALRWSLVAVAIIGLAAGIIAQVLARPHLAHLAWTLATIPVALALAVSIARDLLAGRLGVDAVALLSMAAALLLGESLAGAVVALMYAGGNVLEDLAVFRAEQDLRSLADRAPRVAHRHADGGVEDVPVIAIAVGDRLLVRAAEVIPVDGIVDADGATIDESTLTGEPIPAAKPRGAAIFSGTLNAGNTFDMTASSIAGESTYAGIVRLVTAAQTAKTPFMRLADRYALVLLPVTADDQPIGALLLADELRPETPRAIRMLRAAGVARIIMLTGDHAGAAGIIGAALDLDSVLADRAPAGKVDAVRAEQQINPAIMVGDGINDAPALAAADVGVAMGAGGASASSETAQVVILANRLDRVGEAIIIAQRARRIAIQSITVGMGLSFVAMLAATAGWLTPVPAAILQEVDRRTREGR